MDSVKTCQDRGVKTSRLILRPLRTEDAQDMFEYSSDSETCRYLRWGPHCSISEAKSFISHVVENTESPDIYWAICIKDSLKMIGVIRIYKINADNKVADVSYILNREYTGKGFMTECLKESFQSCQMNLGINTFRADFVDGNSKSQAVMIRCGMSPDADSIPWKCNIKGAEYNVYRYKVEVSL